MRARGGESWRGRGGKGGGDDAMFGNRYQRAHAQGTTRVVGGAGRGGRCWAGWGRGERAGRQLPVPNGPNGYQLWSPLSCGVKAHCSLSPSKALLFRPSDISLRFISTKRNSHFPCPSSPPC